MNRKIKRIIYAVTILTMLSAFILNFISYFDSNYLYDSALKTMSLSEKSVDISILTAAKSFPNTPNENIEDIDDEPVYNEVKALDLSRNPQNNQILLTNETAYEPDVISLLKTPYPIDRSQPVFINIGASQKSAPLVLIIHTHGTEAFYPLIRSANKTENIVSVGSLMADILNKHGVETLHCDIMHDEESYLNSYNKSKETILKYLEEYPSIQYVFDVHRDAVIDADGQTIKAVTTVDGKETAQIMCVVGSDYKGGNHPNWLDNLNVAVKLQYLLNGEYTNIARPINIRSATFNAQYAPGSLLLEIGSSGNTLTEAKRAAILTAEKLADLILGSEN